MKKYAVEIFLLSIALLLVLMLLIVSNSSEGPSGPGWEGVANESATKEAPGPGWEEEMMDGGDEAAGGEDGF